EDRLTMRPKLRSNISGRAALQQRNWARRLVSTTRSQSSSVIFRKRLSRTTPALLTKKSNAPWCSPICEKASCTAPPSVRSRASPCTDMFRSRRRVTLAAKAASSRSRRYTVTSFHAKRLAIPRPIPRAAPVTTATWPLRQFFSPISHPQHVHGRGRMIGTSYTAASALGHSDARRISLTSTSTALQLPHQLDHLRHAGGAQRMPLGQQAAAGVDRHPSTDAGSAGVKQIYSLARCGQTKRLVIKQFGDG